MLELTQLQYFVAVAKAGSITKAAKDLYITQSALSRVIFRLESELGAKLFDRSRGRIFLNDSGKAFLEHVTVAMDEISQAVEAVSQSAHSRPIVIYNLLSINMLLYTFTERCQADFPTMTFNYVSRADDEREEVLSSGEASVVLSPRNDLKHYIFQQAFAERWCIMVNKKYQFKAGNVREGITLAQLAQEPIVYYGSPYDQQFIQDAFAAQGLKPVFMPAESVVDSGLYVNKCQGVALVPLFNCRSVSSRVEGIPIIAIPLLDGSMVRQAYLGRHKDFPANAEEGEVLKAITDHIRREAERDTEFDFSQDVSK